MSHNHPLSARTEQDILELTRRDYLRMHTDIRNLYKIFGFISLLQRESTENEDEFFTCFDICQTKLIMKMVQIIKKHGDRKKYYMIVQSWDTRMIYRLRINTGYAKEMKKGIGDFIEITKQIDTGEDISSLLVFFQDIHHSYNQFEQYFKLLEVKFLNIRLKEQMK